MRSGAGLVTLGIPAGLNNAIIKIKPAEVMTLPLPQTTQGTLGLAAYNRISDFMKGIDVIVIGPGLSRNRTTQSLIRKIISHAAKAIIIDADGLNALQGHPEILLRIGRKLKDIVITPHPGEMAGLLRANVGGALEDRKRVALEFARKYNLTVALKGNNTVVASRQGFLYVNKTGNPGMATAGSGDVLTGIAAAFLGQGLNAFRAAKYAVYLHGLAGDLAAQDKTQLGMLASDIIGKITAAIKKCS